MLRGERIRLDSIIYVLSGGGASNTESRACQMGVLWLSCFPELLWEGLGSD